ncbi:type II secretion system protein [Candidatus Magnetomonas plexicatena]|uniref:type II secretion system protein n=1 Tax=Candidatus Magnetomonas plexicatena TaxID=2552947 RepID=UPI001C7917E6|nr:type II secretion system protein [Nitrospirales bacterium LBB_01]
MTPLFRKSGFTLVEIVVAMFIAGVLCAATVKLWDVTGLLYFHSSLKQKAIFALNSQTERLTSLYRWCDLYSHITHSSDNISYRSGYVTTCNYDFFKTNAADFTQWEDVYYDSGNDYDAVYVDKNRNVVGKLYWTQQSVYDCGMCSTNGGTCSGSGDDFGTYSGFKTSEAVCLTINLDYPYRWDNNTLSIKEDSAMLPHRTIKVMTIVATKQ